MPPSSITRRDLLLAAGGLVAAPAVAHTTRPLDGDAARTRLVLLGTAGGPTPKLHRAAPAAAVVVGDRVYLVDFGDGVARQFTLARLPFAQLRAAFITHQHSDHNAGYGSLFLLAWASGLQAPVDVYGPPPLEKMTRLFLEEYELDITTRMADEGRPPLAPLVRPHEVTKPGPVFTDDRVKVTCALNHHPPIRHSFAFRFDTPDRSIVLSGDTTPLDAVRDLARGADVLVHEALYKSYFERPDAPQPSRVVRHILASHTDAEEAGRIAAAAGVGTLVLTHFVPSDPQEAVSDDQWMTAAGRHFKGRVILGKDLMEI